jgi:hypothetical protein
MQGKSCHLAHAVIELRRTSRPGKGRWVDNVLVERQWRSGVHEDVYLRGYETSRFKVST